MRPIFPTAVLALSLCLTACGDHLGEYHVEDLRVVKTLPPAAVDGRTYPQGEYLRVELSSQTSLYAAHTGPGLYIDADFCRLRNRYRLIAFGPDGDRRERGAKLETKKAAHARPARQTLRFPPRYVLGDAILGYDLHRQRRDVCLRFFIPGYNIIPSRSDVVQIPAETLILTDLADLLCTRGKTDEAVRMLTHAAPIMRRDFPDDPWRSAWVDNTRGACLLTRGDVSGKALILASAPIVLKKWKPDSLFGFQVEQRLRRAG